MAHHIKHSCTAVSVKTQHRFIKCHSVKNVEICGAWTVCRLNVTSLTVHTISRPCVKVITVIVIAILKFVCWRVMLTAQLPVIKPAQHKHYKVTWRHTHNNSNNTNNNYYYYYYACHLYARYLQLHTWNKPCHYGMQCCSCSVITVCATCNVISPVQYLLLFSSKVSV